ncbi:MAG: energy transducer TonB [Spirochaetaceae bacterium]|jgi:protein TonB|nr:energy transducer TonB [Spirochaetaceae bacterium]
MTERKRLPAFFAAALALHLVLLFSPVITIGTAAVKSGGEAGIVMKLTDIGETLLSPDTLQGDTFQGAPKETAQAAPEETLPSPGPLPEAGDSPGLQRISGPGQQGPETSSEITLAETAMEGEGGPGSSSGGGGEAGVEYLPMYRVSKPPSFAHDAIRSRLNYPPQALRFNIEGLVYLELFVDRDGTVRRITILREDPPGRGFGQAAIRAFEGLIGIPAEANGIPVAVRYRYPLRFTIR